MGCPCGEPLAEGFVGFDAVAGLGLEGLEEGGIGEGGGEGGFGEACAVPAQADLVPCGAVGLPEGAGEGVYELVGDEDGVAGCGEEGGGGGCVPADAAEAEAGLLEGAERG